MKYVWILLDSIFGSGGRFWASSLQKDYSRDPVYLQKLQELIDRNKQFESERNDRRS